MRVLSRVLLITSVFLLTACSKEILLRDLPEREVNEIIAILSTNSIEANKITDAKGKSFAVEVNQGDLARATSTLQALGYPKESRANLNEIFKPTGFAPTPFEERVRYVYGISQELERTISVISGVLHTRVHVVVPPANDRKADMSKGKASVLITYDDRVNLDDQIPKIRQLVAESLDGLSPDRVEVLAIPSSVNTAKTSAVSAVHFFGVRIYESDFALFLTQLSVLLSVMVLMGVMLVEKRQWKKWFTPLQSFLKK